MQFLRTQIKTLRNLVNVLLAGCGDIDEDVYVKICRRDKDGVVTHISVNQVSYIDSHGNICIEESGITWAQYV